MSGKPTYEELEKRIKELEQADVEHKNAKAALHEKENFLTVLLNAIPIPVFYKDKDGRYIGFNEKFESFFGETRERLVGKTVFEINPPELAKIYHAMDNELLKFGGVQQYESQVKNSHGELRDVIFNKSVYTDNKGTANGLIGAVLDITERKQTELKLRESEEKFKAIFENANDGILVGDIST